MVDTAIGRGAAMRYVWQLRLPKSLFAYALLAPSLLLLLMFTYAPILQAVVQSLTIVNFQGEPTGFGLGNFFRLFADVSFRNTLINTIIYSIGTIFPSILIALFLALSLGKSSRYNAILRTAFFFPVLIPMVAASALFMFIFMPTYGLIDHNLAYIGVSATNWLGNPDIALWSIVGLTVWKNSGYYMLFFIAGLQAVPPELHEAAKIDGAGALTRFFYITLPMLRPTLAFVVVISIIYAVTQVDHIIAMTKGGPSDKTNILLYYIFQAAHEQHDTGRAAAATVFSVAILLALSLASLKTLERGTTVEV